ncbi:hypothetical protein DFJ74DRAFT_667520 [Hyaloraphidium curvatum]|nr:hypothetical protein DFJ74DRAFT_667520 [Hyaloraphidium curvatum]
MSTASLDGAPSPPGNDGAPQSASAAAVSDVPSAFRVLYTRIARLDSQISAGLATLQDADDYLKEKANLEREMGEKLQAVAKKYLDRNETRLSTLVPKTPPSPAISAFSNLLHSHIASAKALAAQGTPCPDLAGKQSLLAGLLQQAREYGATLDTEVVRPVVDSISKLRKDHENAKRVAADAAASLAKDKDRDDKAVTKLALAAESARMDAWERGVDLSLEIEGLANLLEGVLGDTQPFDPIKAAMNTRCGFPCHLNYLSGNLHQSTLEALKASLLEVCASDRRRGEFELARTGELANLIGPVDPAVEARVILESAGGSGGVEIKRGRGELVLPVGIEMSNPDEEGRIYLHNKHLHLAAAHAVISAQILKSATALSSTLPTSQSPYGVHPFSPAPLSPPAVLVPARKLSVLQLQLIVPTAELGVFSSLACFDPTLLSPTHNFRPLTLSISTTHCDVCSNALLGIGVGLKCELCGARVHTGQCEMRCPTKCMGKGGKDAVSKGWVAKRKDVVDRAIADANARRAQRSSVPNSKVQSRNGSAEFTPATSPQSSQVAATYGRATAMYSYAAQSPDELTVQEGEEVELLEANGHDQPWVHVRGNAGSGIVPASYLNFGSGASAVSVAQPATERLQVGARMTMAFTHTPGGQSELGAAEGEAVEVTGLDFATEGWVKVRSANGEGLVPKSYLV